MVNQLYASFSEENINCIKAYNLQQYKQWKKEKNEKVKFIWLIANSGQGKTLLTSDLAKPSRMMQAKFENQFLLCDDLHQPLICFNDIDEHNITIQNFSQLKTLCDGDDK